MRVSSLTPVQAMPSALGSPPRPILAYRVGVTGTRNLAAYPGASEADVRHQIRSVLQALRDEVAAVRPDPRALAAYAAGTEPLLRLLTPLAEGADRLVAEVARDLGYDIEIALPFARADYARDFSDPTSSAAFDRWLGPEGAPGEHPCVALDGGRGDDETASYEAVGRLVVRNCDLLIAVWDGRPARGRGGTGDIVRFSLRFGVPVWWIDATGAAPPRLLQSVSDLRAVAHVLRDAQAAQELGQRVRRLLLPPTSRRHAHSLVARPLHRILGPSADPLHTYLRSRPLRANPVGRLYDGFYRLLAGARTRPAPEPAPTPDGPATYWDRLYRPADRAATDCAARYRSSYVWVFLSATLAVGCAVLALAHEPWKLAATSIEVALLGLILVIVAVNERRNWHGRWIACRLLAELCRKQGALAAVGWSLPPMDPHEVPSPHAVQAQRDGGAGREARAPGAAHADAHADEPEPAEAWVGWYFDSLVRGAPLPRGDLSGPALVAARDYARIMLVEEQRCYHEDRQVRSRRAGRRLVRLGEVAFLATLVLVLVKLVLLVSGGRAVTDHGGVFHGVVVGLGAVAAMLPAASAAFFAIRAYAELELLEHRSARMARRMARAAERLDQLDLARPLASQDLGAEIAEVSAAMLQEVNGWADLFRVKAVETG